MPLIAMNREIGSLGKDVARGLEQLVGMRIRHHEIIDHLANRARMRKSHVISYVEGRQGLLERLTTDQVRMQILTADEILSIAESGEPVILRGWGASSLLKYVPHAICVCVTASRKTRVQRMKERLNTDDGEMVTRIVDENDDAARAVMRRSFHIDPKDVNEYDMSLNTDRISVRRCVDEIARLIESEEFRETDASRQTLSDIATAHHIRAALRTHSSCSHCLVRVTANKGQIKLDGIVNSDAERDSCGEVASRIKQVKSVENAIKVARVPARLAGDS